ncbi:MAG: SUMF1/EgtB/PvdO family nonheme iron enzyme [Deltaproteobacteria bacterium]|nr:SUMF1/EgtB/PvdO family nonheme iron enzyme [Deltaproteobacteria bacterium]
MNTYVDTTKPIFEADFARGLPGSVGPEQGQRLWVVVALEGLWLAKNPTAEAKLPAYFATLETAAAGDGSLVRAFHRLPDDVQTSISEAVGSRAIVIKLLTAAYNPDAVFDTVIQNIARDLYFGSKLQEASVLYSLLIQDKQPFDIPVSGPVREFAKTQLAVLQGNGDAKYFIPSLVHYATQLQQNIFDGEMLSALLVAGVMGRVAKFVSIRRSVQLAKGTGAIWKARAVGTAAEVGGLSAVNLGFQWHHQGYLNFSDVKTSLLRNAVAIPVLKGMGGLVSRTMGNNVFLHHVAGTAGLMTAHELEYRVGIVDHRLPLGISAIHAGSFQIQAALGMKGAAALLGPRFQALNAYWENQAKRLELGVEKGFRLPPSWHPSVFPRLSALSGPRFAWEGGPSGNFDPILMGADPTVNHVGSTALATMGPADAPPGTGTGWRFPTMLPAQQGEVVYTHGRFVLKVGDFLPGGKRFQVVRKLGQGGFGVAIQVLNLDFGRHEVIKIPHSGRVTPVDQTKFENETRIAANLAAGIAPAIYDQFEIVRGLKVPRMEYVPGVDLRDLLDLVRDGQVKLTFLDLLETFREICDQVAKMHQAGVAHLDLKPENIRIMPAAKPRIMDLGLAVKVMSDDGLTLPDTMAGTPLYMSPEMVRGSKGGSLPNFRSPDIYALGVMLFELVTQVHPLWEFRDGDPGRGEPKKVVNVDVSERLSPFNIITRLLDAHHPIVAFEDLSAQPLTPPQKNLEVFVLQAMERDPAQRYQNVKDLRNNIDALIRGIKSIHQSSGHDYRREVYEHLLTQGTDAIKRAQDIKEEMGQVAAAIHEAHDKMYEGGVINHEMARRVQLLPHRLRELQLQRNNLLLQARNALSNALIYEPNPQGKNLLAEVAWIELVEHEDRLSPVARDDLVRTIEENDTVGTLNRVLSPVEGVTRVSLTSNLPSLDPVGMSIRAHLPDEHGNYLPHPEALIFKVSEPKDVNLKPGYYQFEFVAEGYAPLKIPVFISLRDVRNYLQNGNAYELPVTFYPTRLVPKGFYVISAGDYYTGMDVFYDGDPSFIHSRPLRREHLPAFAMSDPVQIRHYKTFLQALVAAGRVEEAQQYLPRYEDLTHDRRSTPSLLQWEIIEKGSNQHELVVPAQDKWGDSISDDQPVHSISHDATTAFTAWFTQRALRNLWTARLPTVAELEKVARNGEFKWNFPWGNTFDPLYAVTSMAFSNPGANRVMPVGGHPKPQFNRDRSLFGPMDIVGNTRELTLNGPTPNTFYYFGGSNRTPDGGFFWPAGRHFTDKKKVQDYYGSFRLVYTLPDGP